MSTLVERLRESARHRHACQITAIPPLPLEQFTDWLAADRIVALEAENATLKAENATLKAERKHDHTHHLP